VLVFFFNGAPCHEGILGSGGIVPRILDLGTRLRWVVSFTPRLLYPKGKRPWYPLDRRPGAPQSLSGRGGEENNSQSLPGVEPAIIQTIAQCYTTELSRLLLFFWTSQNALRDHPFASDYEVKEAVYKRLATQTKTSFLWRHTKAWLTLD
jgi:hypothetical protein